MIIGGEMIVCFRWNWQLWDGLYQKFVEKCCTGSLKMISLRRMGQITTLDWTLWNVYVIHYKLHGFSIWLFLWIIQFHMMKEILTSHIIFKKHLYKNLTHIILFHKWLTINISWIKITQFPIFLINISENEYKTYMKK